MPDFKRGDDAADHVPKPSEAQQKPKGDGPLAARQDAPNYDSQLDDGRAEPVEAMNSANDE